MAPDPLWSELPVATFAQLMVMSVLGPAVSYREEKEGRLVKDVFPKAGQERRQERFQTAFSTSFTGEGERTPGADP